MNFRLMTLICILALTAARCPAQPDFSLSAAPVTPAAADPAIAHALQNIQPQRIQETINKLVSFGNRSTLSSMDTGLPPGTGVLAASDWIFAEFSRISAACGNCLEVKRDDFIEPPQADHRAGRGSDGSGQEHALSGTCRGENAFRDMHRTASLSAGRAA